VLHYQKSLAFLGAAGIGDLACTSLYDLDPIESEAISMLSYRSPCGGPETHMGSCKSMVPPQRTDFTHSISRQEERPPQRRARKAWRLRSDGGVLTGFTFEHKGDEW
jgi:hypothetical protein